MGAKRRRRLGWADMANVRTFKLIRARTLPNAGNCTLFFHTEAASRGRQAHFFKPHEVPEFEGEEAVFECERRNGRWRVLRRVDQGSGDA